MRPIWRSEDHVGEWKVTVWADTIEAAFTQMAKVAAREAGPLEKVVYDWEPIEVTARNSSSLLVDFLNDLIGRMEIRCASYLDFRDMKISDNVLTCLARANAVADFRSSIKAAVTHGAEVSSNGKRWKITVIFDV
jgi:SHS2 domain-containing protein